MMRKEEKRIKNLEKSSKKMKRQGICWLVWSLPLCVVLGIYWGPGFLGLAAMFLFCGGLMLYWGKAREKKVNQMSNEYHGSPTQTANYVQPLNAPNIRYCDNCGASVNPMDRLCRECGKEILGNG